MARITDDSTLVEVMADLRGAVAAARLQKQRSPAPSAARVDGIFEALAIRRKQLHKHTQVRFLQQYLAISRRAQAAWEPLPITGIKALLFALQVEKQGATVQQRKAFADCLEQWRVDIGLWEDDDLGGTQSVWTCRALREYCGRGADADGAHLVNRKRKRPLSDEGDLPSGKRPMVVIPALPRPRPPPRPSPTPSLAIRRVPTGDDLSSTSSGDIALADLPARLPSSRPSSPRPAQRTASSVEGGSPAPGPASRSPSLQASSVQHIAARRSSSSVEAERSPAPDSTKRPCASSDAHVSGTASVEPSSAASPPDRTDRGAPYSPKEGDLPLATEHPSRGTSPAVSRAVASSSPPQVRVPTPEPAPEPEAAVSRGPSPPSAPALASPIPRSPDPVRASSVATGSVPHPTSVDQWTAAFMAADTALNRLIDHHDRFRIPQAPVAALATYLPVAFANEQPSRPTLVRASIHGSGDIMMHHIRDPFVPIFRPWPITRPAEWEPISRLASAFNAPPRPGPPTPSLAHSAQPAQPEPSSVATAAPIAQPQQSASSPGTLPRRDCLPADRVLALASQLAGTPAVPPRQAWNNGHAARLQRTWPQMGGDQQEELLRRLASEGYLGPAVKALMATVYAAPPNAARPALPPPAPTRQTRGPAQPQMSAPTDDLEHRARTVLLAALTQEPWLPVVLLDKVVELGMNDTAYITRIIESIAQPIDGNRGGPWRMQDSLIMALTGWQKAGPFREALMKRAAVSHLIQATWKEPKRIGFLIDLLSKHALGAADVRFHIEELTVRCPNSPGLHTLAEWVRKALSQGTLRQLGLLPATPPTAAWTPRKGPVIDLSEDSPPSTEQPIATTSKANGKVKLLPSPSNEVVARPSSAAPPVPKGEAEGGQSGPTDGDLPPHPEDLGQPITEDEIRTLLRFRLKAEPFSQYWAPRLGKGKNTYERVLKLLRRVGGQVGAAPDNVLYLPDDASNDTTGSSTPGTSALPSRDLSPSISARPGSAVDEIEVKKVATSVQAASKQRDGPVSASRSPLEQLHSGHLLAHEDAAADVDVSSNPRRKAAAGPASEPAPDGKGFVGASGRWDGPRAKFDRMEPMRTFFSMGPVSRRA